MSENIRTRDSVEHVPQQNSLPKRANRGGQARRSANRAAQPQEEPATIRLPDLPQIPPHQQVKARKKPKFGKRGKIVQESAGFRQFRQAWLANMLEEMSAACDRFWQATPERRAIEAKRHGSGFNYRSTHD
jgi:hypothetical protein